MGYANLEDVLSQPWAGDLLDLADPDEVGVASEEIIAKALAKATVEMDAYVGAAYQLPLLSIPPLLQEIACTLARLYLHTGHVPPQVEKDVELVRDWLKRIASGQMVLDVLDEQVVASPSGSARSVRAPRRITANALRGFL